MSIKTFKQIKLSKGDYRYIRDNYGGICANCKAVILDGIEPDAQKYLCELCDTKQVYGIDEYLIRELLDITDSTSDIEV